MSSARANEVARMRVNMYFESLYWLSLLIVFARFVKFLEVATQMSEALDHESKQRNVKQLQPQLGAQRKVALVKNNCATKAFEKARSDTVGGSACLAEELNSGELAGLVAVVKAAVSSRGRGVNDKNVNA